MRPSVSESVSDRSNFAVVRCAPGARSASGAPPPSSPASPAPLRGFCHANITWKSGVWASVRTGSTRSTTCSKGMSWFRCASSARRFTCSSSPATVSRGERSTRSASVFTKKPISPSISGRPRLAVGVPTTTASCPESRASTTAQPATRVMKGVVPCRRPSAFSPAVSASSSTTSRCAPAWSCRSARGWSAGSSSSAGTPASVFVQ